MLGRKKIKRIFAFLVVIWVAVTLFSLTASADTGPKPSIRVTFEGLGNRTCYGTLLSKHESTGPASVWDGKEETAMHNGNERYSYLELDEEIWRAFVEYQDTDGYYFLQRAWKLDGTNNELAWTYYPPDPFKILLYFPEQQVFVVSEVCERYAFHSYFSVNMTNFAVQQTPSSNPSDSPSSTTAPSESGSTTPPVGTQPPADTQSGNVGTLPSVERSYDYSRETFSFIARVVLTFAIEIEIALFFGMVERKQIMLLGAVNGITQLALNVCLNLIQYHSGYTSFLIAYVLLEIAVFVGEAVIYVRWMPKISAKPIKPVTCVIYSLVANAASFGVGLAVAKFVPNIFS